MAPDGSWWARSPGLVRLAVVVLALVPWTVAGVVAVHTFWHPVRQTCTADGPEAPREHVLVGQYTGCGP
jgi:hypothetical protein